MLVLEPNPDGRADDEPETRVTSAEQPRDEHHHDHPHENVERLGREQVTREEDHRGEACADGRQKLSRRSRP